MAHDAAKMRLINIDGTQYLSKLSANLTESIFHGRFFSFVRESNWHENQNLVYSYKISVGAYP